MSITIQNRIRRRTVASTYGTPLDTVWRGTSSCDNRAMSRDDRFEELITSLGGFYRSWLIHLGLELGLFEAIRAAGSDGIDVTGLAAATDTHRPAVETWAWAVDAHGIALLEDGRLTVDGDVASILLDDGRADHLGGQFSHAVVASMDWAGMAGFFRTGVPIAKRPDRYRVAIERLTRQDVAVFFSEVLAAIPQLVLDLSAGGRVVDIHCGGGRWLISMAQRFAAVELIGVETEPDSVARARAAIEAAGLSDRIVIDETPPVDIAWTSEVDLAYFQYALHALTDPAAALRAAWAALRPGGRILVLDWPLPSDPDEFRTRHGELITGVQLDEMFQGTALASRERYRTWFDRAGLPEPTVIDLPSGAAVFLAEHPG